MTATALEEAHYLHEADGVDFFTSCTQEAAWQVSDFPSGSLCASQKGTGAVVKYYSLTFYLLTD